MFFIFHFSFSAESKKKLFYSPWKFGREKVEKYTLFSCFFTFSGRKMLKSILFWRFWVIFKKVFCFLFFIFHFSFSPNSKKKLFRIFFKKVFLELFSPRLFNRPFREKNKKLLENCGKNSFFRSFFQKMPENSIFFNFFWPDFQNEK